MVTIKVLQKFLDGHDAYYPGELRTVTPEKAGLFCSAGWAVNAAYETSAPNTNDVTLDVHNAGSTTTAIIGGNVNA